MPRWLGGFFPPPRIAATRAKTPLGRAARSSEGFSSFASRVGVVASTTVSSTVSSVTTSDPPENPSLLGDVVTTPNAPGAECSAPPPPGSLSA